MTTLSLAGYHLTFDDEFGSFEPTEVGGPTWNGTVWVGDSVYGSENYTLPNDGLATYLDDGGMDPFSVGGGVLTITATSTASGYVTGAIDNRYQFAQTYGYFEMRAELPQGAGMWPGFWLLPANDVNGGTPEIDVMEAFGASYEGQGGSNQIHFDLHDSTAPNERGSWVTVNADIYTSYNTYGLLWEPTGLTFYFNGQEIASLPEPSDLNQPMYMVASLLVGGQGDWPGPAAGETASMEIDFIRAYSNDSAIPVAPPQPVSSPDGGGLFTACYAQGTRIQTTRGAIKVENLRVGDRVVAARAERDMPIRWIGSRRIDFRQHPCPEKAQPVRIRAGAFGPELPVRDLWLSPDHAVFVDDVLIPVQYLCNGATILRESREQVVYWHVELPQHDVILAEGLPCESYLDTGNRDMFDVGAAPTFPQDSDMTADRAWTSRACARLVERGPVLAAVRKRLAERARRLGHDVPEEAALHITAPGTVELHVGAATSILRIICSAYRQGGDRRTLGALIRRIRIDGEPLALDDPRLGSGLHEVERHGEHRVRWTDGEAMIRLGTGKAVRRVEIDVAALAAPAARAA